MSLPTVKDFFSNKVSIKLKTGHKFEGLFSSIDYKNQTITLEDVEDLGNQTDKNFIPHDKKIADKGFGAEDIEEILFKQKHFCEAKKYNKNDFWDATSEPVQQQPKYREKNYGDKGQKPYYKKNYNNDNRNYNNDRNYNNNDRNYNNDNREYKKREGGNYNNRERGGNYRNYNEKEPRNDYRRKEEQPKPEEEENSRDYR